MNPVVRHLLLELKGCPATVLSDLGRVERALTGAGSHMGTEVGRRVLESAKAGVVGFVATADAHLLLRTWPEEGVAIADLMGPPSLDLDACVAPLLEAMRPTDHLSLEIARGIPRGVAGRWEPGQDEPLDGLHSTREPPRPVA